MINQLFGTSLPNDTSIAVIPADYRPVLTLLVDKAAQLLARGMRVPCRYYIGCNAKQVLQAFPINTDSPKTEHMSATIARRLAAVMEADFVIMTSEVWAMPFEQVHLIESVLARFGSIAACPERVDAAYLQLETRDGVFAGIAPINQPLLTSNRRTSGKVTWFRSEVAEGALNGILPKLPITS